MILPETGDPFRAVLFRGTCGRLTAVTRPSAAHLLADSAFVRALYEWDFAVLLARAREAGISFKRITEACAPGSPGCGSYRARPLGNCPISVDWASSSTFSGCQPVMGGGAHLRCQRLFWFLLGDQQNAMEVDLGLFLPDVGLWGRRPARRAPCRRRGGGLRRPSAGLQPGSD